MHSLSLDKRRLIRYHHSRFKSYTLSMEGEVRKYGNEPFNVVLVHGGPGGAGELKPVAIELGKSFGVLEPFQTKLTIEDQVEELRDQIDRNGNKPVTLIGWSWGAWLTYIFASKYPESVKKLILISSGPFEQKYVEEMNRTRMSHLSETDIKRLKELEEIFKQKDIPNIDSLFEEFGAIYSKADTFEHNGEKEEKIIPNMEIYNSIWPEAAKLRESGELLETGKNIKCEVVAIHGEYDPHPYLGVKEPLTRVITNFKFILLEKCGHHLWFEKHAKDKFYEVLLNELR